MMYRPAAPRSCNWRVQQRIVIACNCALHIEGDQVVVVGVRGPAHRFGPDRIGSFQQFEHALAKVGGDVPTQLELTQIAHWALHHTTSTPGLKATTKESSP